MEAFITYLIKSSIGVAVFYIAYYLLFQKSKNFTFNRIFLISSFLISFIIPAIKIRVEQTLQQIQFGNYAFSTTGTGQTTAENLQNLNELNYLSLLFWVLIIGAVFFLIKLIIGNIRALTIIHKGSKAVHNNVSYTISNENIHPFSYFSKIIIPHDLTQDESFEIILNHEYMHVNEKHTIDVILAEILFLFQWFNPFAWLLRDSIKSNLEYLTDDKVVQKHNRKSYQMAMVNLADKDGIAPFLTALNGSQLKNRIVMMNSNQKNKKQIIRKLLLVPVLTVLIVSLSNKEYKASAQEPDAFKINGKVTSVETGEAIPGASVIIANTTTGTLTDMDGNFTLQGINEDDELSIVHPGYEQADIAIDGQETIDISLKALNDSPTISIRGIGSVSEPLIIIDGEPQGNIKIEDIDPEDIERIDVLKDESSIESYGEKAKNGVIIITTKKSD